MCKGGRPRMKVRSVVWSLPIPLVRPPVVRLTEAARANGEVHCAEVRVIVQKPIMT